MKAIYLLITNGILSIVMSQQSYTPLGPIEISNWDRASVTPPEGEDCNQMGAYDEVNDLIQIFGGAQPLAHYTFNITSQEYIYVNNTALSRSIVIGATGWVPFGNKIYYENTNSGEIRELDINTAEDTFFAALEEVQAGPGLCVNESSGTVYSVGNRNIEACTRDANCTRIATDVDVLTQGQEDALLEIACAVYEDRIYTFGGYFPEIDPVDVIPVRTISECTLDGNCTQVETLAGRRFGIRLVVLPCFKDQYVVLIGGSASETNPVSLVELFDMENNEYFSDTNVLEEIGTSRRGPVAVYDTMRSQMWSFGGEDSTGGQCSDEIESSNAPVCFTLNPTMMPTFDPTKDPTSDPTADPTDDPTSDPTMDPTSDPTFEPTIQPTDGPTQEPITAAPVTAQPTADPASTDEPTKRPTTTTTYEPITEGYTTSGSAYGVVIGLLIAICCIIAICAFWYSKEEKDHVYGRMEQGAAAVVAGGGGGAVPMVAAGAGYGGYEQPKAAAAGGYDNGTAATGYTQSTDQKY